MPTGLVGVDSARKEAEELSGKRSEMAEMRSKVPQMESQWRLQRMKEDSASELPAILLTVMDSTVGESSMRKEPEEESGKRSEMQYEWMKRPEEREDDYMNRLRYMMKEGRLSKEEKFANAGLRERRKGTMRPARGQALGSAGRLAEDKNIASCQQRKDAMGPARGLRKEAASHQQKPNAKATVKDVEAVKSVGICSVKAKAKPKPHAKDAEAAQAKGPEESVTEAGKPEESVTVGSSKSVMDQELIGSNCTNDEEMLRQMLQFKLDRFGNSFVQDEAEENERRAILKEVRESLSSTKKAFLHWPHNWPIKDEQSRKAEAPVTESVTVGSSKSAMEHLFNKETKPAADPNSVTIQDDHVDRAKSALAEEMADDDPKAALAKETAEEEEKAYHQYRKNWENNNCCCKDCDHFEHKTVLSSMQFTQCTPGMVPYNSAETLQIFSIKLKLTNDNACGFQLPLSVYGMVAVRDTLDPGRNILFSCNRTMAQELTQDDPFLHITGPSRAILSADKVIFEAKLIVKDAEDSEDKPLITCVYAYAGGSCAALCFGNILCTLEVCLQTVKPAVQATILAVQFVKKKDLWPINFTYGGLVACTPLPRMTTGSGGDQNIVLIESKGREMPQGIRGYVPLSRKVVCVDRRGGLDVVIQAYKKSGAVAAEGRVHFKPEDCHISQQQCIVGQAQVTVTVAWSIVPTDMDHLMFNFSRRFQV